MVAQFHHHSRCQTSRPQSFRATVRFLQQDCEVAVCEPTGPWARNLHEDAIKTVMATNRPDILDPALLRPGRLDRKIEIPEPNESQRMEILRIHSKSITTKGDIDFESVCKLSAGMNGADLRNVVTEAGLFAIRADRDYVLEEDFFRAARKLLENKKLVLE